jgi:hypothetical protein
MKQLVSVFLCLLGLNAAALAQDPAKPAGETKPAARFATTDGYPADTCFVSGETLDGSAKTFTVDGHTFKTCCNKCKAKIEKDAKTFIAKKEEAVTKAQSATYALTTCPISGKALNDKAVSVVADNTLVKLCCEKCKDKLMADTASAIAKVQGAAFDKQAAHYTAKTCPASGHELDAKAVSVMHGTTLVKLCCSDCMEKFTANANAMAAKVATKADAASPTKTNSKTEGKTEGKTETKGDKKSGQEQPLAAAVAGDGAAAACCKDGDKAKAGGSCCESGAAKADGKKECCEGAKAEAKTEAKAECCESKAKAETAPKKVN